MINVEDLRVEKIPTEKTIQEFREMETQVPHVPEPDPEKIKAKPIPFRLLSIEDMAAIVNCSARAIYTMKEYGRIPPAIKIGNLVRWDPREVQKWVDDRCPSFAKKVFINTRKRKS